MNYKAVSCKRVIDKVFGAYGTILSQHTDRLVGEGIVWIGDALESIGSVINLEDKVAKLTIKNGRAPLPCGLHLIESVAYNGQWLRYGSGTFNFDQHCEGAVNATIQTGDCSYIINPNYICTSNIDEDEVIYMAYKAFPLDEEGFPMIPDNFAVSECLFWYLTRQLILGGFEHPSRDITFNTANAFYVKHRQQAENQLEMFDIPRFESFARSWARILPNINAAENFFHANSIPETFTKQSYRR
jgi:hypothetical protein